VNREQLPLSGTGLCVRFSLRRASQRLQSFKIDMEAIYGTLHPDPEKHFRETLSEAEFKQMQLKRFHLAIHYCNQLSNNAHVFLSWTRYERKQEWVASGPAVVRNTVREL
jgi:hypothetical protein